MPPFSMLLPLSIIPILSLSSVPCPVSPVLCPIPVYHTKLLRAKADQCCGVKGQGFSDRTRVWRIRIIPSPALVSVCGSISVVGYYFWHLCSYSPSQLSHCASGVRFVSAWKMKGDLEPTLWVMCPLLGSNHTLSSFKHNMMCTAAFPHCRVKVSLAWFQFASLKRTGQENTQRELIQRRWD